MNKFLAALKRALKGVVILAILLAAVTALMSGDESGDHELALELAGKLQAQCARLGRCPATPDVFDTPQAFPLGLEYRLDPGGARFVLGYKGTVDPDCGHVVTGGVEWLPEKQRFCEGTGELVWRGVDGMRQTMPVVARHGESWSELRRMFPREVGLR